MPDDINVDKNSKGGRAREPRSGGDDRFGKGARRERKGGRDEAGAFTEVEINLGREQYIKPNKIMGIINDLTGNSSINFGRIDIHDSRTFVGVESAYARDVADVLDGMQFGSIKVKADVKSGGGDRPHTGGGFNAKKKYGGFKKKEFGAKSKGGYKKGGKNPSGKFKKKR